jgi:hypothetical protein
MVCGGLPSTDSDPAAELDHKSVNMEEMKR